MENAIVRVPDARGDGGREADQRPRGVHAGRRVHPRPVRRARLLGRGRLLRARARRRGRDGPARRRVDRRGHAVARRLAHGLAPLRRRLSHAAAYTLARTKEVYETYYDVKYPGHERPAGRPLRRLAGLRAARGARRRLRREVGLGARELVRAERRATATSRCGRAAGRASSGRRRSAPSTRACRETAALFDEIVVREDRGHGRRRGRLPRAAVREPGRARGRARHLHADAQRARRHRVRLHRHPARRRPVPDRHRHRVRAARPRLDPPARAGRRLGARRGRDLGVRVPRALGAAQPGDPAAADDAPTSRTRRSRT